MENMSAKDTTINKIQQLPNHPYDHSPHPHESCGSRDNKAPFGV